MEWFERALTYPMFLRPNVWAIAGESRFFDSNRHIPSDVMCRRALELAENRNLIDQFVYLDFCHRAALPLPVTNGRNLVERGEQQR